MKCQPRMSYAAREIINLLFSFLPVFLSCLFPPNHHTVKSVSANAWFMSTSAAWSQINLHLTHKFPRHNISQQNLKAGSDASFLRFARVHLPFHLCSHTAKQYWMCIAILQAHFSPRAAKAKREGFRSLQSHLTSTSSSTIFFFFIHNPFQVSLWNMKPSDWSSGHLSLPFIFLCSLHLCVFARCYQSEHGYYLLDSGQLASEK